MTGWDSKLPYARALRAIAAEFGYRLQTGKDPNHSTRWTFQFVRP